jgi:hypothetical protein
MITGSRDTLTGEPVALALDATRGAWRTRPLLHAAP